MNLASTASLPPRTLAFGYGAHFCVGNMVARMESRVALDVFLDLVEPGILRLKPGVRPSYKNIPSLLGHDRIDVELVRPLAIKTSN